MSHSENPKSIQDCKDFIQSIEEIRDRFIAKNRPTGVVDESGIKGPDADEILNDFFQEEQRHHEELIAPIIYQEREMVMTAESVRTMKVAADSGAVDHIANASNLPGNVILVKTEKHRDFINASGGGIKNHGEANVRLKTKSGRLIANTFQVADVCRPLHSIGKVCDGGHEVLFMKGKAVVVPEGSLEQFLGNCAHLATYERENGLYVMEVEVSAVPDETMSSFPRPVAGR